MILLLLRILRRSMIVLLCSLLAFNPRMQLGFNRLQALGLIQVHQPLLELNLVLDKIGQVGERQITKLNLNLQSVLILVARMDPRLRSRIRKCSVLNL